jgi:sugar-phosphatase
MPDLLAGRAYAAFLFDMDGTLLSSIAAAERVWTDWARAHGVEVADFLPTIHGRRAIETIADLDLPGVDPAAEAAVIHAREVEDVGGIEAIPGAAAFLAALPAGRWAIVSSAPRTLALRRLQAAGLPASPTMVLAEDVVHGKPAPDCFLLAARRLGVDIADCLVFEDAPAGIAAAEAAGADVVVVTATHRDACVTRHPCIAGFDGLRPQAAGGGRWRLVGA